jgi:hypothetical protein
VASSGLVASRGVAAGLSRAVSRPMGAGDSGYPEALLTPLLNSKHTLEETCNLRALEREAAALRLERA